MDRRSEIRLPAIPAHFSTKNLKDYIYHRIFEKCDQQDIVRNWILEILPNDAHIILSKFSWLFVGGISLTNFPTVNERTLLVEATSTI